MFENKGYFIEYYIGKKYIGSINGVEKDREILGYFGSKIHTTTQSIKLDNGKIIKSNTIVETQLHYLNGKKN